MEASNTSARIVKEWMAKEILHDETLVVESVIELGKSGNEKALSELHTHLVGADEKLVPLRNELYAAYKSGGEIYALNEKFLATEKKLPFSREVFDATKKEIGALAARQKIRA